MTPSSRNEPGKTGSQGTERGAAERKESSTGQILLIEDSETMRSLIATTVEQIEGLKVISVRDGFEALRTLPHHSIRLIITDINMPDINGLEVIHFVKNHPDYREIPLLIVSTEQSQADIQRGLSLGASAYMTKPFMPDKLIKTVEELLGCKSR